MLGKQVITDCMLCCDKLLMIPFIVTLAVRIKARLNRVIQY